MAQLPPGRDLEGGRPRPGGAATNPRRHCSWPAASSDVQSSVSRRAGRLHDHPGPGRYRMGGGHNASPPPWTTDARQGAAVHRRGRHPTAALSRGAAIRSRARELGHPARDSWFTSSWPGRITAPSSLGPAFSLLTPPWGSGSSADGGAGHPAPSRSGAPASSSSSRSRCARRSTSSAWPRSLFAGIDAPLLFGILPYHGYVPFSTTLVARLHRLRGSSRPAAAAVCSG